MELKKNFNVAAAICSVVLGAVLAIGVIVLLVGGVPNQNGVSYNAMVTILVFALLLGIAIVLVAIGCIQKRDLNDNRLKTALLVLMILFVTIVFVGNYVVIGALGLVPVALEITSMVIVANDAPSFDKLDEKIIRLKKLKDDNLITEEQYNKTVEKIISGIK